MAKNRKKRPLVWRITKIFFISLGVLILLLFLIPILFRPQLVAFTKKQLNKQLNATVDFKTVKISLFRNFPRLDIQLVDLSIIGKDQFPGDTLLLSPSTHIITNIKTLFRSNVKVYAIDLVDPVIRAKVDSNGNQNFDIVKKSSGVSTDTSGTDFSIDLEKYSIRNGTVSYYDDQAKIYTDMKNFDHGGKGNFTDVKYKINSTTKADSVNFRFGQITYLTDAVIDLPLDLDIDDGIRHYTFLGEEFFVNSVPLYAKGDIKRVNDSTDNVEIAVKSKQSEFKDILTLLPGVYTENLKNLQTSGKATIDGRIYGNTTATRTPNFNIKIDVVEGFVKNPDFNEPIKNINVNGLIVNTGGANDSTVITLKNGRANIGADPVQFAVGIARPVSSMFLDLSVKGKVQLEKLKQILRLGDMDLRGLLNADLSAKGPLQAFKEKEADAIRASGFLTADNFYYKDKTTLPFNANKVVMKFNNAEADLDVNNANYNKTNFSAKGSIFNFFNYLFVKSPLRGKISASSPEVDLANWASNNAESTGPSPASKPFIVPYDLMLDIDAHADRLITEKVTLSDIDGRILFGGRKMMFENVSGKGFGGTLNVDGSYSSEKTPLQPDITLNYKLVNLDVQQTFKAFVTAKNLMPIGDYLSGTMSSELSASGKLGDNFMPIMNSLNGNGNLLLLNGLLQKFAPLEKIAERLDIDRLKTIATKEIRNRFAFENGLVSVLPFKFTIFNDYDFEIAGKHGFDNSMDYGIKLSLPRKDLGPKGNQLYQSLLSKIGKIGLDIKPSEKIKFFIKLSGTLRSPVVDIELDKTLGSEFDDLKKQAEEQLKNKIDSAKNVIKDSLKKVKDNIITGVKDKIKDKIFNTNDTTPKPPKDTSNKKKQIIKDVINIFNPKKKKDSL